MKFRSSLLLLLSLFMASWSFADDVTTPVVSVVNVKTTNPAAYRAYLMENPEIFEDLHHRFEFPALSIFAKSALSVFVDISKEFYIHQPWSGVTKNASQLISKAIKNLCKRAGNSNSWCKASKISCS